MNEAFEYYGRWWLPESPDKQYWGTLAYEPTEGLNLTLENWQNDQIKSSEMQIFYPIILGVSNATKTSSFFPEKQITLMNCCATSQISPLHFVGARCKFFIDTAFVGVHFNNPETIKFKNIYVRFLHLDEWLDISGFKPFKPILKNSKITIKYRVPKPITVSLENYQITFRIRTKAPLATIVQKEVNITQNAWVDFEASKETDFVEFRRLTDSIQNFLILATVNPVHPICMEGESEANKQYFDSSVYYPPIGIFYTTERFPTALERIIPMNMLFTYRDVKKRKKRILSNWIKKHEKITPVFNLFLSLFNSNIYLEDKFLSLIYSLEALHRRTKKNQELPRGAHAKRLDKILNKVPSIYREWLQNKLAYSNEPPLRARLKDLLDEFREIISIVLKDEKYFIHKICVTRNYYTHYDLGLEREAAKGQELYHLIRNLKLLLLLCFLREVGFYPEEITNLVKSHIQEFTHISSD